MPEETSKSVLPPPPPTAAEIRRWAVESSTHPRTVTRLLRGERVQPMTRDRIVAVLRRRGLLHLLPEQVG